MASERQEPLRGLRPRERAARRRPRHGTLPRGGMEAQVSHGTGAGTQRSDQHRRHRGQIQRASDRLRALLRRPVPHARMAGPDDASLPRRRLRSQDDPPGRRDLHRRMQVLFAPPSCRPTGRPEASRGQCRRTRPGHDAGDDQLVLAGRRRLRRAGRRRARRRFRSRRSVPSRVGRSAHRHHPGAFRQDDPRRAHVAHPRRHAEPLSEICEDEAALFTLRRAAACAGACSG